MSRTTRKGYDGEEPVHRYLKERGFFRAYRLRSQGVNDKGDIGGIDGAVIEIKNQTEYRLSTWMKETAIEKARAGAKIGALVIKPLRIGSTRVGEWWVMMTLDDYACLLERAGYGPYEGEPCIGTVTPSPTTPSTSRTTLSSSEPVPIR